MISIKKTAISISFPETRLTNSVHIFFTLLRHANGRLRFCPTIGYVAMCEKPLRGMRVGYLSAFSPGPGEKVATHVDTGCFAD